MQAHNNKIDVFEDVHMVWEMYDRPRSGIADFRSAPHFFTCPIAPDGGYGDIYHLTPVGDDVVQLARRQGELVSEWDALYQAGLVSPDTHPTRPGNCPRYDALERQLQAALEKLPDDGIAYDARFKLLPQQIAPPGMRSAWQVSWWALPG